MSKKRPAESGWESDEDDLLTDTGISAFRHEDVDELDEDALLGADDGGHTNDIGFEEQGQYGEAEEMLEIQVKDEELDEEFVIDDKEGQLDYYDDEYQGDAAYGAGAGEPHGLQEAAYEHEGGDSSFADDSVSQTDGSFHHETEESEAVFLSESDHPDVSYQNESQDAEVSYENEPHTLEGETPAEEEVKLEESDSDDSGDEDKHSRGRFISERSNIITLSKAKSRTDIPDTLEVSTEQQKQPVWNNVQRSRANRGGGQRGGRGDRLQATQVRQAGRRGMLPQGPFQHARQQPFGIRLPPYPQQPRHFQGHLPQFGQPLGFLGDHPGRLRFGPPQRHQDNVNLGRPFGEQFPASQVEPRPLMRIPPQQGNRILVPNQQGGFNMVPRQHLGGPALLPGQVPPGTPAPLHPQQSLLGSPLEADQPPVSVFLPQSRPNIPTSAPPRPHKIHINPNFRGPVPGAGMAPPSVVQMQPEPTFSQPGVHHTARLQAPPLVSTSGQMLVEMTQQVPQQQLLPGQPRPGAPFSQLFPQQGPQVAAHGMMQQGLLGNFPAASQITRPGLGQQQPGFPSPHEEGIIHRAQGGDGLLPEPPQFSQGLMHLPHPQQLSPGLTTSHLRIQPTRQQLQGTGISISQSRGLTVQTQQRQLLAAKAPRRMAIQQRMPQKPQTVVMAKKLAQQARVIQQTKATANKNITVVPLTPQKRRSTDNNMETPVAPKVARTVDQQQLQEEEPMDEELKRGLEEQKRKREEIRRKKEEARKRQAEIRRKELEERLAKQGLTIDDIISEGKRDEAEAATPQEVTSVSVVPKEEQPIEIQGAQPITTLVSRGVQQPIQRRLSAGNQPLRLQGRMGTTKRVAEMRHLSQNRSSSEGENVAQPAANLVLGVPQMHQPFQIPSTALTSSPSQQFHPEQPMQRSGVQRSQMGLRTQRQHMRLPQHQGQQLMPRMQHQQPPRMQQQQQQQQGPRMQQPQMLRMQQQGAPSQQQTVHHLQSVETFGVSPQQGQPHHPSGPRQALPQFSHQQHVSDRPVSQNQQQHQFQQQHQQPHFSVQQQHHMQENQMRPGEFTAPTTFRQTGRGRGFQNSGGMGGGNASRGRGSHGSMGVMPQGYGQAHAQGQVSMTNAAAGQAFERVVKASSQTLPSARTVISTKSQATVSSGVSNRTVIPLGHQLQAKQRQVVKQGTMNKQAGTLQKVVAGPSTLQKVSIDNLSVSTTAHELKAYCEAIGPIEDNIVMLESQRKAIITFKSKIHAMTFVKKWDRRMINLSIVHVTMLP